jgi:cytochrome c-type biogenesis protein CcmH
VPSGGRGGKWALWLAAAALACVAAVSAAGLLSGGGPKSQSLYQRTMAIAGEYRCPVCAGESAAASDAPAAVDIRDLIRKWLEEGHGPAEIRSYLVADYGQSILEKPPASGLDSLVWIVPLVVVALGLGGLGFAFYRWRVIGEHGHAVASEGQSEASAPGQADARARAPAAARGPGWGRARRLALPVGAGLMALALALLLVDHFSAPALPGGTITGGATGLGTELEEAQALAAKNPVLALELYQKVLKSDPVQPIALTAEGWIYAEAGFTSQALAVLGQAEKADPSYGPAHLYRGLVLLGAGSRAGKQKGEGELEWYLAHDPTPKLAKVARKALTAAKPAAARG